jgi:hypothetical protein
LNQTDFLNLKIKGHPFQTISFEQSIIFDIWETRQDKNARKKVTMG